MGWTPVPSATDTDAIHDNVAGEISALTEKATPANADLVIIEDSAASFAKKKARLDALPGGGGGGGAANYWEAASVGSYDDYFDADNSANWTAVAVTGTATWAYRFASRVGSMNRGATVRVASQSSGDYPSYLKSLSGITTGDYVQAAVRVARAYTSGLTGAFGIALTDGTSDTSNAVVMVAQSNNNATNQISLIHGTLTLMSTVTLAQLTNDALGYGPIHLRLVYSAANTFQGYWSINGEDFFQLGSDLSKTMTPTHGGFTASTVEASGALGLGLYFHSNVTP